MDSKDAEIYRELRLKSLKENPEAFLTTYEIEEDKPIEKLRGNLIASDNRFTLGAFINSVLIGTVTFVRESNPKIVHKGNVYAMYVAPEFREKGIGKSLVQELIIKAKKCDGLEQINLTVISNNNAAKRLYETIGFVTYGTERNALKTECQYWDENLMVFRLN
ncbi:GNAT family N-acetyltransferase [Paenibacillus sp. XY044]|uniref:GNAT family N-acetyltransferase n=1 Tax=Paenibacillus sp. XY044 TaxID=2026089 RepID=UPI0027952E5C|nr:GNAT family N-acetyltransferase [Paenibacillus sp. XY044]